MAEEAAPRDGDAVLTLKGLRETLWQIIREEPSLLQINAEPAGAPPTPGKSAAFTNPLTKIVAIAKESS